MGMEVEPDVLTTSRRAASTYAVEGGRGISRGALGGKFSGVELTSLDSS